MKTNVAKTALPPQPCKILSFTGNVSPADLNKMPIHAGRRYPHLMRGIALALALLVHGLFFFFLLPVTRSVSTPHARETAITVEYLAERPPATVPPPSTDAIQPLVHPSISTNISPASTLPFSSRANKSVPVHGADPSRSRHAAPPLIDSRPVSTLAPQPHTDIVKPEQPLIGDVSVTDASLLGITPEYPHFARQNHQQGRVVCRVIINESGVMTDANIAESSGFRLLDQAAVQALKSAAFSAALHDGKTTSSVKMIAFNFKLLN